MKADKSVLDEARVFFLTAGNILPLVEKMRTRAIEEMIAKFRSGERELIAEIARIDAIMDLESQIKTKIRMYEKQLGE